MMTFSFRHPLALRFLAALCLFFVLAAPGQARAQDENRPSPPPGALLGAEMDWIDDRLDLQTQAPAPEPAASTATPAPAPGGVDLSRSVQTVALFAVISLAPVAVLMATAFVRIQIVLLLVKQGIGSPQIPGNQVLTGLAVLLTALIMAPTGERVYRDAIAPYSEGKLSLEDAWSRGSEPIKLFMIDQIYRCKNHRYLIDLHRFTTQGVSRPASPETVANAPAELPTDALDLPMRVVAPAFLISELTTAFWVGFLIYLPFLVVDLVVASVLAAAGLVMLPPSQVSMPLKLVLFVLADGWWLLADGLLRTFTMASTSGY